MTARVITGDMREVLAGMPAASHDVCIVDPPYGIFHDGNDWDKEKDNVAFQPETWKAVLRVLKPAAWCAAFSSNRTFHRTALALEQAGFTSVQLCVWITSSGFAAAQDVGRRSGKPELNDVKTILKPCLEAIILARAPLPEGEKSIIKYASENQGRGCFQVRKARLGHLPKMVAHLDNLRKKYFGKSYNKHKTVAVKKGKREHRLHEEVTHGRYPANVVCDDSPEVAARFPVSEMVGESVASFFYHKKVYNGGGRGFEAAWDEKNLGGAVENRHPTIKPINLMAHYINLLTPDGGVVLDCFCGSGSTGCAAVLLGHDFVGVEKESEYAELSRRRIAYCEENREAMIAGISGASSVVAEGQGNFFEGGNKPQG